MILHEFSIDHYSRRDVFKLKPCFDWHCGNRYADIRAIKKYLSDCDDNTYLVGGGDMMDCIITKDIKRYMKHSDATKGDDIIDQQVDELYEILKPFKGRIIGIGTGNHESTILKHHGSHPSRRLAKALDTVSLGYSWLIKIKFRRGGSDGGIRGGTKILIIRGHHGWGGGSRTQGADLTKYSKDITFWEADIFLYGHVHRRQSDKVDRLYWLGNQGLIAKPKHIFLCGTFLKTLSNTDEPTYSEEKGYPPVAIGGVTIRIRPGAKKWMEIDSDV